MAETKWFGKYRAIVMDNNDPERRGRVRVQCPKVLGNYLSSWCEPCIPYATDYAGDYYVPPINETIWVEFEEGNVDKPIWGGGWYKIDSTPLTKDSNPTDYRYITFKNSVLRMGEKEFIFELRDSDKSYTVKIDTSTWIGLNYIGSKSEQEILDLETIIANKEYLLDKLPNEILPSINNWIQQVEDNFTYFAENNYNPFVSSVNDHMETYEASYAILSEKMESIANDIQSIKDGIQWIKDDIQNLKGTLNNNINKMNNNLYALDGLPAELLPNYTEKLDNV